MYLDNIVIYAHTYDEHLRNLDLDFSSLEWHSLTFKPSKCTLFKCEMKFLGYIASKSGVLCNPEEVVFVSSCIASSQSQKDVRQFWGFALYHRKFVKNFAKLTAPMYNLTKKPVKPF